jgi:hypothetical protein
MCLQELVLLQCCLWWLALAEGLLLLLLLVKMRCPGGNEMPAAVAVW